MKLKILNGDKKNFIQELTKFLVKRRLDPPPNINEVLLLNSDD